MENYNILNIEELPKVKYKGGYRISWKDLNCGFIIKTNHPTYGYNEFTFESYSNSFLKFKDIDKTIRCGDFSKGKIGRLLNKITNDFKIEVGTSFTDNRNIVVLDRFKEKIPQKKDKLGRVYFNDKKTYVVKCLKCSYVYNVVERHLLDGTGCPCCCNRVSILGVNTIYDTYKWLVDDFGLNEDFAKTHTYGTKEKGEFTCKHCGRKRVLNIFNVINGKSISCICGDGYSYPEKIMANVLKQLAISCIYQYSPEYLIKEENGKKSKKKSDFYLPNHNLIIEVDGGLGHEGGKTHGCSKKSLEHYVEIDKWKDEQHLLHGLKTIRIDCFKSNIEYIRENILKSELNKIFDLSKIDWLKCEEFAINSNKVKEVCDYWNNKKSLETTKDLAKFFELSNVTIINYLKKGSKLGLCEYDPKEEMSKNGLRNGKKSSKKIEVFKEGISLGCYNSSIEIESISEDKFGVKLNYGNICACCRGKTNEYKGYVFRYV